MIAQGTTGGKGSRARMPETPFRPLATSIGVLVSMYDLARDRLA
jgi:hypothetical protein